MMRRILQAASVFGCALLLVACGARKEYAVEGVTVDRIGWDSLVVHVEFSERTSIGGARTLKPDSSSVIGYDANHDTLFAGQGPGFSFPDHRLGDREGVVLDVCGAVRGRWICEQTGVRASPKRVKIDAEVDFPIDDDFSRGRYSLAHFVERDELDGHGSERIRHEASPVVYLEAFVDGAPDASVRLPLARTSGAFDLARSPSYSDFRFYLESNLMDHGEVDVHFRISAGLGTADEAVAMITTTVSSITREDRLANVEGFIRQASRALVDDLASFLGGRRMEAYLNAWHFDRENRVYQIDMEVRWRGSFFDQRSYELEGVLTVGENGEAAVFAMMEGNRPAVERWNRRIGRSEHPLGTLRLDRPPSRYRPGSRQESPPL